MKHADRLCKAHKQTGFTAELGSGLLLWLFKVAQAGCLVRPQAEVAAVVGMVRWRNAVQGTLVSLGARWGRAL